MDELAVDGALATVMKTKKLRTIAAAVTVTAGAITEKITICANAWRSR